MVRRLAVITAQDKGVPAPQDKWGHALAFLAKQGVLDAGEEAAFGALYTFVSNAAHVPLSDQEWARVARTFVLSSAYYLLKKVSC